MYVFPLVFLAIMDNFFIMNVHVPHQKKLNEFPSFLSFILLYEKVLYINYFNFKHDLLVYKYFY
jgi:hypothetical protein